MKNITNFFFETNDQQILSDNCLLGMTIWGVKQNLPYFVCSKFQHTLGIFLQFQWWWCDTVTILISLAPIGVLHIMPVFTFGALWPWRHDVRVRRRNGKVNVKKPWLTRFLVPPSALMLFEREMDFLTHKFWSWSLVPKMFWSVLGVFWQFQD